MALLDELSNDLLVWASGVNCRESMPLSLTEAPLILVSMCEEATNTNH